MVKYTRPLIHFVDVVSPELLGLSPDLHERLSANHAIIIWGNQGVYRLFPSEMIQNSWTVAAIAAKQKQFFNRNDTKPCPLRWSQGYDIPSRIVGILRDNVFADHVLNALKEPVSPQ